MNTPNFFTSSLTSVQRKNLALPIVGALIFPGAMLGQALAKLGLYSTPVITGAVCLPPEGAGACLARAERAR